MRKHTATIAGTAVESVDTSELRQGDIVWCHGLRLVLGPFQSAEHHGSAPGTVYWSKGTPLNPEFLDTPDCDRLLRYFVRLEGTWTVQGNHLARWAREVPNV